MRRIGEIFACIIYIVLVCMAMASCVVVLSCAENETDRAAPNMIAHDQHVKAAATRPALMPFVEDETVVVREYYAAIASKDQKRFVAAKGNLADAVKATDKAMGGGK